VYPAIVHKGTLPTTPDGCVKLPANSALPSLSKVTLVFNPFVCIVPKFSLEHCKGALFRDSEILQNDWLWCIPVLLWLHLEALRRRTREPISCVSVCEWILVFSSDGRVLVARISRIGIVRGPPAAVKNIRSARMPMVIKRSSVHDQTDNSQYPIQSAVNKMIRA
jgi:hypothetical protein